MQSLQYGLECNKVSTICHHDLFSLETAEMKAGGFISLCIDIGTKKWIIII